MTYLEDHLTSQLRTVVDHHGERPRLLGLSHFYGCRPANHIRSNAWLEDHGVTKTHHFLSAERRVYNAGVRCRTINDLTPHRIKPVYAWEFHRQLYDAPASFFAPQRFSRGKSWSRTDNKPGSSRSSKNGDHQNPMWSLPKVEVPQIILK